jgi:carbon storage regulator
MPLEFIHGGLMMLVLSRKERERIRLGDSIVLTIVRVSGDRVRLGIEAPADMLVLREELDTNQTVEVVLPAKPA